MTAEQIEEFERDNSAPLTVRERIGLALAALALPAAVLMVALLCGCTTENTWRANGIGLSVSTASVTLIYGELNKIPPGGYFESRGTIDLRPFWKKWFCDPETNCLAEATIILDARHVPHEAGATNAMETAKGAE